MLNSLPAYRGGYAMEGRLADGAYGKVYRARDTDGRLLAVRVLEGPLARVPELPERLRAEADLLHDNILAIVDLFQNTERIGIVTGLLEGQTLRELIAEDHSSSLEGRIEIMTRVGEALRFANANGVAHQGLKPSRIHVLPDGAVKVRSFSVDLLGDDMRYLAPEQLLGQPVDALCNFYTFGAVLNELTANCADRPTLLADILERAQNRDRSLRYQNYDALLADIARLLLQVRKTDLHFSGLFETVALSGPDPTLEAAPEENFHLTVQRPEAVRPGEWKTLLGTIESTIPIPLDAELTFVPQMDGVEFNPRRISFQWQESLHQASFRLRASPAVDGQSVRGQMSVYLGRIVVAQVPLRIGVNGQSFDSADEALASVTAPFYRRIFPSYSDRDAGIEEELQRYGQAMGDEYLREVIRARSGGVWTDRLMQMIGQADVFQLFWSSHSMRSPFVRQEWQYALTLHRDSFVRPVYWEEPLPELAALNLPPPELWALHFHRMVPDVSALPARPLMDSPVAVAAVAAAAAPAGPPPLPPPAGPPAARAAAPVWSPPQVPAMPASYVPMRGGPTDAEGDDEQEPRRLGLQWAAALIIIFGIGGLSWYGLQSRKPAPGQAAVTPSAPAAVPVVDTPEEDPAPATVTAQPPVAKPSSTQFTISVWSRGVRIRPGQTIRGGDPLIQASFGREAKVSSEVSLRVDWFVNGALAGKTEFEPSEKGKHKPLSEPPEGDYRAVLMVDGDEAASVRFTYRK